MAAVKSALVMQRSGWRRREIRRICSVGKVDKVPYLIKDKGVPISLISGAWRITGQLVTACHIQYQHQHGATPGRFS